MAENLFETVNDGYEEMTKELKGLSNVEQVLLDTADSVIDTKKKIEFGVKQIIFKIGELVKLSGGSMNDDDAKLKAQFEDITRTILDNQNQALANLTQKVEKSVRSGDRWASCTTKSPTRSSSWKRSRRRRPITSTRLARTWARWRVKWKA